MRVRTAFTVLSLGLVLGASSGCRTMTDVYGSIFLKGAVIDYVQYQQVDPEANPKPSVDDVMAMLGDPMEMNDRNGSIVQIAYHAYGLDDSLKRAEFRFNAQGKLVQKLLW